MLITSPIQQKIISLIQRHEELGRLLSEPTVVNDQKRFREISKEYAHLESMVTLYHQYEAANKDIAEAEQLIQESDGEFKELAKEELQHANERLKEVSEKILLLLLPEDPNDDKDVFLEIRAGAGGDESGIFAGDLFRMYTRYAENNHWQVEILNSNQGEHGGYREIIARIHGKRVYSRLKFESGVHRVQRVPETEAQGRVHTSTCTVAILPEVDEISSININPADLRIDTFRASGAGGQHVNKTDSAIRITHIPTGTVVECQEERSQHKNRARAMSLLQAKLLSTQQKKQRDEQAEKRRGLIGSGDRSERIRTYNFPQNRLTDHRINLTLYKLDRIIDGALDELIDALIAAHQASLMAELEM